MAKIKSRNTLE